MKFQEDSNYLFDAAAADRVVRFIEKYCVHFEGKHAGDPFILHPEQRQIVRDLFGWKGRATGLRRFTDCYFEGAVGSGKSPLLAAIGLYGLMADGEESGQLYSLASTYGQARIVFDTAKAFARSHPELEKRLELRQYEIRHPASGSVWRIVSGKGPGAGCRPSMILADEVHEWANACGYQALRDRMFKRRQPLLIAATNAGESRASFCWTLREKAVAAQRGDGDPALYPVIWAAPEDARTDDPDAWRAANPLMGVTVSEASIRQNAREAMKDEVDEANFRRLYMSIWPKTAGGRWLDLAMWDACTEEFQDPDAPVYVGLDLSLSDDLCSAVYLSVTPERFMVRPEFWLPRATAERYQNKDAIPYLDWAKAGAIHLVDEPTIGSAVRKQIAASIIAHGKNVKAVCYDRYRADETVAALEAAGLTCVPIAQGYSVSPGCNEVERRLKDHSIMVAPNPVMRFCAENARVKTDDRGNIWPVKPNANGQYKGKRGLKIDGISALVTAATQARKHTFPTAKKEWKGSACLI